MQLTPTSFVALAVATLVVSSSVSEAAVQCAVDDFDLPEGYTFYTDDDVDSVDFNGTAHITCDDGYYSPFTDNPVLNVTCTNNDTFANYTFGVSPAPSDVPVVGCSSECYGYTCDFWICLLYTSPSPRDRG